MPLLAADPVIVEPAQREALEALVRAHSTSQQVALRACMILQAADDVGVRESARELSLAQTTFVPSRKAESQLPLGGTSVSEIRIISRSS
jgi:hypothetical protein